MLVDAECLRIDAVAGARWWLFGFTLCVYCLVGGFGVCLVACCLLVACVTLVCGIGVLSLLVGAGLCGKFGCSG